MRRAYERRYWTDDEHARMIALRESGMTVTEMGRALGRAASSINGRLACTDETGRFRSLDERTIKVWTPAESDLIAELRAKKLMAKEIAVIVGATARQVQCRLRQIARSRMTAGKPKESGPTAEAMRTCLTCLARGRATLFLSPHAGCRRCKACRERAPEWDTPYNPGIVGAI
jgi:hypothetical protein